MFIKPPTEMRPSASRPSIDFAQAAEAPTQSTGSGVKPIGNLFDEQLARIRARIPRPKKMTVRRT